MTTPSDAAATGSPGPHRLPAADNRPADCWREIGVGGDRSCPELARFIHCRNCPVMSDAAAAFFDRPPPAGYLDEWREVLEAPLDEADSDSLSLLVFRLADEWFALAADVLAEVTPLRTVHKIPHRSNSVLAGLVNVRGQLLLCGSLHGLLGLRQAAPVAAQPQSAQGDGRPSEEPARTPARLLVAARTEGRTIQRWAFAVDEVAGVQRIAAAELRDVPSTLGKPGQRLSAALFSLHTRRVSLLDAERLFAGIHEQIPQ
jgi:chemotaxis-related protein WspD